MTTQVLRNVLLIASTLSSTILLQPLSVQAEASKVSITTKSKAILTEAIALKPNSRDGLTESTLEALPSSLTLPATTLEFDSASSTEPLSSVISASSNSTVTTSLSDSQSLIDSRTVDPILEDVAATPSQEIAELGTVDTRDQLQQYTHEGQQESIEQVTSVSQLSDVQTTDWAFQALQSLVERYGCIAGYPDGTFRGGNVATRYELAAGLNACLDRVSELLAAGDFVTQDDLATIQQLQDEFAAELATLRGRVDALEARTTELEGNQFSTTTKLVGDALFYAADVFGEDVDDTNNTVFQYRLRLTFDTSFTGTDRLRTRLQSGNFTLFNQPGTEARFAGELNTNNDVVIDSVNYTFQASDNIRAIIFANAGSLDELAFGNVITPFDLAAARGSISRFGQRPPIYRVANTSAGAGVNVSLTEDLSVQLGYLSGEAGNPANGAGFFNGNYGILGQVTARELFGFLDLGLTYVHSYTGITPAATGGFTAGIRTGTGSTLAAVDADRPVVANSYGIEANLKITPGFQLGGWAGFSAIRAIGLGDADVWNYGATLDFPNLFGEGNLGGIVVGVQPRLTGTNPALGAALGRRNDPDVGLHIEAFYRFALNDYIDITPGVFWLTAPNHDDSNADIVVGLIRTTIRF